MSEQSNEINKWLSKWEKKKRKNNWKRMIKMQHVSHTVSLVQMSVLHCVSWVS